MFPYICLALFAVGHIGRFYQDRFAWTKRTVKAAEERRMGTGSTLVHYGILASLAGHALGAIRLEARIMFSRAS